MKSILFATTERTTLAPLAESFAAAMLPLVDRPVMVYTVELLARFGIRDISIVLTSEKNKIETYFKDGKRWNVNLSYVQQNQSMGENGFLQKLEDSSSEPVLVMPADSFFDFDIDAAVAHYHQSGAQITMILSGGVDRKQRAYPVRLNAEKSVVGLKDYTHVEMRQATGAYLCDPQIVRQIPSEHPSAIYDQLIPELLDQGQKVSGFEIDGYWNPLDSFAAYADAQEVCLAALMGMQQDDRRGRIHKLYADGRPNRNGLWRAPSSIVHPTARITAPAYVGEGCQIGADVEIGPNVVIGSHVVIDEGATIRNSTVFRNTYVGQLVALDNRFVYKSQLIDAATGEHTNITDDFLLSEASSAIVGHRIKSLVGRMMGFFLSMIVASFVLGS